jgi:Ca-activated chloride channel family protein
LAFLVDGSTASELELRLVCDGFDALEADNHAFICLPALHPLRVFVADGLNAWKRALSAHQEVQLITGPGAAELVVSDAPADLSRPAVVHFTDGFIPDELTAFLQRSDKGGSTVVDYHKGDPLLTHVAFEDLLIREHLSFAATASEADLEARGFTIMVYGDHGPLLLERSRGSTCDYHLLFHSDQSTLPFRLGFPVLAGNLVARTLHLTGQDEVAGTHTGLLPAVRSAPDQEVTVTGPDGSSVRAHSDHEGLIGGVSAMHAGIYHLHGSTETALGASLLDSRTTRLTVVETLHMHEVAVPAGDGTVTELSLWKQLAVLALLIALVEWWFANRRPSTGGSA